jgi:hypothetical protein
MFKICNDKTYYVVQTTSEDVVVEIYTKKDGRGSNINLTKCISTCAVLSESCSTMVIQS